MVDPGVALSDEAVSDLLGRDSMDGAVRQTIVVEEEGKPAVRFVSTDEVCDSRRLTSLPF
jgi:hypothetical protein